jgi:hypothetical protein
MADADSYWGWIEPCSENAVPSRKIDVAEEREFLESLGIKVGPFIRSDRCFDNCEVPVKALDLLDPHWGRFIWGLFPGDKPRMNVTYQLWARTKWSHPKYVRVKDNVVAPGCDEWATIEEVDMVVAASKNEQVMEHVILEVKAVKVIRKE